MKTKTTKAQQQRCRGSNLDSTRIKTKSDVVIKK